MKFLATVLLLFSTALLTACAGGEPALPPTVPTGLETPTNSARSESPPVKVVTTNAVLADLIHQVGGSRVDVHNLAPAGSDVHTHQTTPMDSVRIAQAHLIVTNGAGLAPQFDQLLDGAAEAAAIRVVASDGLVPSEMTELIALNEADEHNEADERDEADEHDDAESVGEHESAAAVEDEHGHDQRDPHFWQDPHFVVHYVNRITDGLIAADPQHTDEYRDNARRYVNQLAQLDDYITERVETIPAERRVLVTFHDAYGYFGARYGFEVLAFIGSHGGDVSPDDIVSVLELVQSRGLPAIFAEPQFSADAVAQVARDSNIQVGAVRSLPDAEYPSYIDMMRANADSLADRLQ